MAYMDAKSKHGMSIEMKEKGYASLKQTEDEYYSTIDNADNTLVTARTPPVQPAIPNRVQNQQTKNVISDSQLQFSLKNMKDDIDLLKRKNNRLKIGLIISLFVIFVAIGGVSATAMIFKQNLEDSLKRKIETHLANTNEARVSEATWTNWLNWDTCSATCNVGVRRRTRTCNGISQDGLPGTCSGNDLDISICNEKDCTRSNWARWLNWGACSTTCNAGVRRRKRTCNSQYGQQGFCLGTDVDISTCDNDECTRSNWAQWLNWGACSTTCNTGVRRRKRTCNSQYGQQGFCLGNDVDISTCNNDDCTGGIWAQWLNWGACSTTCNTGVRRRKRTCSSRYGQQGFCLGTDVDISICNNDECTQEVGPSSVSFTSYLSTTLTNVRVGTTVVFDIIVHNAGNAYSALTGVFTCPTAGTYLFSLTAQSANNNTILVGIFVDGDEKVSVASEPAFASQDSSGTADLVYYLSIGQRVWAETYTQDNIDIYKGFTSFVGVLIHR